MKQRLVVLALLCSSASVEATTGPLVLTVRPASVRFAATPFSFVDGTVHFEAVLTNRGRVAVWVSRWSHVAICAEEVARDGKSLHLERFDYDSVDGTRPRDTLVELQSGASLTVPLRDFECRVHDTGRWQVVRPAEALPGKYRARFRYRYDGDDYSHPNVFRGTVYSSEITFELITAK